MWDSGILLLQQQQIHEGKTLRSLTTHGIGVSAHLLYHFQAMLQEWPPQVLQCQAAVEFELVFAFCQLISITPKLLVNKDDMAFGIFFTLRRFMFDIVGPLAEK